MRIQPVLTLLLSFGISATLLGCGGEEPAQSDAEFIETVRTSEAAVEPVASEAGLIDPDIEGNPPTIVLETNHFDMGLIPTVGDTFKDMKVFNRGDQPLIISNIATTCPCTKGEMVEDTIPAGGVGTLRIQLDTDIVPKYYSQKVLTLTTNDPVNPRVQLAVTARLDGELKFTAEQIVFPETLEVGVGGEHSIRITQSNSTPIKIIGSTLQGAPVGMSIEVTLVPENDRADATIPEWDVTVTVDPGTPSGNYRPVARIAYNDGRDRNRDLTFPVRVMVKGIYNFEPQEITMRNVNPGEVYEGVTTLSAEVPFTIDSVTSSNPAVNVTHAPGDAPNTVVFSIDIPERPDNRLQKDEWTIAMTVDGKSVTESVKLVALLARQ